jgi:molybdate transport system substrate-binding protein
MLRADLRNLIAFDIFGWIYRCGASLFARRLFLLAALSAILPFQGRAQEMPVIAAASDLSFALSEIATVFKAEAGREVRLTFGSSGNFTRQILQRAPFEMFLSADENFVYQLADAGRTVDRGELYAIGRIVLFVPHGSPVKADAELADLRAALADGRLKRLAIANSEHAPYGRAAEQVLRRQQLWDAARPLLVLGENVSQAAQFASTGSAQAGLFAYSLVLSPSVGERGRYVLLPADWHEPLRQRMVLTKEAGPIARQFYAFVQGDKARAIFRRYGFALPHEAP